MPWHFSFCYKFLVYLTIHIKNLVHVVLHDLIHFLVQTRVFAAFLTQALRSDILQDVRDSLQSLLGWLLQLLSAGSRIA